MSTASFFDAETGQLEAGVFSSPKLYRNEINSLFGRAWLLVAPQSWLTDAGSFVTSYLGETAVLAWRDAGGGLGVFLNRCSNSAELITQEERGRAQALACPCHGWSYRPLPSDHSAHLEPVARVETFSGFVFASFDAEAPPLREWLGDFTWCWQQIDRQFPGGIEIYGEAPMRTKIRCNWKLAAEAYAGDVYSDLTLTRATREILNLGPALTERDGLQIATESGAMAVLTDCDNENPVQGPLIPVMATLFPNISYDGRGGALHVWHPRGPLETEMHTYCLVGADESHQAKEVRRKRWQLLFGPAGMLTQDYALAWSEVTRATRQAKSNRLNLQMGLGRERTSNLPGRVSDLASEMNQRAFYTWWQSRLSHAPRFPKRDTLKLKNPLRREPSDPNSKFSLGKLKQIADRLIRRAAQPRASELQGI